MTKRVALAHFRVGETDGVSLEMAKWKKVLERLGHKAHFCAGTLGVRSIESTVVPNVFDFVNESWTIDDYNSDFRFGIHVKPNDIIILQATRIVDRKGIELAVDLVAELNKPKYLEKLRQTPLYDDRRFRADNRIVLVLAGFAERSAQNHLKRLKEKIGNSGIDARFTNEIVGHNRSLTKDGKKGYSLWDTYLFADVVTYPSLFEGWGNQFLEAIRAKLPIVLWEYDVYKADIGVHGFDVVLLGDHIAKRDPHRLVQVRPATIRQAAEKVVRILTDPDRRRAMVEHNFQLGRKFYSLRALEKILKSLLEKC